MWLMCLSLFTDGLAIKRYDFYAGLAMKRYDFYAGLAIKSCDFYSELAIKTWIFSLLVSNKKWEVWFTWVIIYIHFFCSWYYLKRISLSSLYIFFQVCVAEGSLPPQQVEGDCACREGWGGPRCSLPPAMARARDAKLTVRGEHCLGISFCWMLTYRKGNVHVLGIFLLNVNDMQT